MEVLEKALEYWKAGGVLLVPIAGVCFGIWLYFLKARSEMLRVLRESDDIEEDLVARLRKENPFYVAKKYSAYEGLIAQAVASALGSGGDILANFETRIGQCMRFLRRDVIVLAGLTAAAPLLGLLGTVRGMIETFTGVAAAGQAADYVAGGISQALITTQVGLVVAIPGVFGIAWLQRVLQSIQTRFASCRLHISFGLARKENA